MTTQITIIGAGMGEPPFGLCAHPALVAADAVIGGKRHLEPLATLPARKVPVTNDITAVLKEAASLLEAGKRVVVLAGGDPLFFGIGARFVERFGMERLTIVPGISSLQAASARLGLAWQNVKAVSGHGRRGLLPLAHALLTGSPVCLLTDGTNTPGAAAAFMLERGMTGYAVRVFQHLGYPAETRWEGSLAETADREFALPNVAFFLPLDPDAGPRLCLGRPDNAYAHERGLITKWPVRAAALAALRIEPRHTVWDLGAGSGSVAVEAASLARSGLVLAVERDAARIAHIRENRRRFSAANLEILHAAFPDCLRGGPLLEGGEPSPVPDRIFIGGGLGQGREQAGAALALAWGHLRPGGRLVAACVLLSAMEHTRQRLEDMNGGVTVTHIQASCAAPLGNDLRLQAENPVFLLAAEKGAV